MNLVLALRKLNGQTHITSQCVDCKKMYWMGTTHDKELSYWKVPSSCPKCNTGTRELLKSEQDISWGFVDDNQAEESQS